MRFVVDASVAAAWSLPDEESGLAERLLLAVGDSGEILVPAIWPFELANVFVMAQRRDRLDEIAIARARAAVEALPIRIVEIERRDVLDAVESLARTSGLTAYDATYLYLAIRERLPLATLDDRLRAAASAAGCAVFA
jgi:predicted nucleic acid-binding protein